MSTLENGSSGARPGLECTPETKLQNFIGGELVEPIDQAYIPSYNPSTGKVYCQVPDSTADDVEAAAAAAKKALPEWKKLSATDRSKFLVRIADLIESRLDEFARAESRDQGKPVWLAKSVDIPRACWNFRFFAGAILHHQESSTIIDNVATNYTTRTPIGVVGLISPWNLPLYLGTWKIAPCIAVGNTCVWKPSEMTSYTAWLLADVMRDAGLPAGVVNIVMGVGPSCGAPIVAHPDIAAISFTGGTATAKHIIKGAAPHFKKLSLELGGKNANIVFEDADVKLAVAGSVKAAFANQGEICLAGSRLFVQKSIFNAFVEEFVEQAKKLTVGDPSEEDTRVGALISKEHMDKVLSYIKIAQDEGATIKCGGTRAKLSGELAEGYFVYPTVIVDVKPTDRVCQEEIFGPVVTIVSFEDEEEALSFANDVQYGLSACVWSENIRRCNRVAQALDVGYVWVNCWMVRDLRVPFGGTKASGIGREGGEHSIDFYTEAKTICMAM